MATGSTAIPATRPPSTLDQAGEWFWSFLKAELSPFPGRAWVVGRVTIAATIVMLLVMIFRIPGGFLAAIFTLFLSRENPTATLRAGFRVAVAFVIATAYSMIGIMTLIADPLTHFLWIVVSLFLAFYLIRIIPDYGTAIGFGFMLAGVIPLWDQTQLSVNTRVETTLWLAFSTPLGAGVTILVEYVFRRVHPATDLTEGIENRLQLVEDTLRAVALGHSLGGQLESRVSQYSSVGTSRLRRLLVRSEYGAHFKSQMNAAVALLGRLVDLTASLRFFVAGAATPVSPSDMERCARLADQVGILRHDLLQRQMPKRPSLPSHEEPSGLPFLPTMEHTAALIPQAFAGSESIQEFIPAPMDEEAREQLIAPDAFSNPDHLLFALRGTLAATAAYVVYTAIDWRGLSTSIATCIITALSTIGSSRQKQILRLAGAIIGGFVFGMGAQVFVLPYLNSIVGFTLLFALVTAISAWIGSSTARLSYLGVQLALAYYLINLQEFTIQTSLAIARDRVMGVLLGLMMMWLFFDRLGVKNALDAMQTLFARNLMLFAELAEQLLEEDLNHAVLNIRKIRDQLNNGFQAVNAQADAVLFEFGPSRQRKLSIREDIRRWQPSLRTLLLVQITFGQYRLIKPLKDLPESVAAAHRIFERDMARVMRAMANLVSAKPSEEGFDLHASAARLQYEIENYYAILGKPPSTEASDILNLTATIVSILLPLYADIRRSFPQHDSALAQNSSAATRPLSS